MHHTFVVVRATLPAKFVHFELHVQFGAFKHIEIDPDVLVPIGAFLLVTEAEGMTQLVENCAEFEGAVGSDIQRVALISALL